MNPSGTDAMSTCVPQKASNTPAAPPTSASKTPSVISCRIIRSLLAPNAWRTAISFSRAAARVNCKLATFAQAIKSKNPTAPNRIQSNCFTLLVNKS